MATIIKVSGADFSANAVGFLPPVSDGLKGWYFPGGDAAKTARNLAPGGSPGALGNSPVISAHWASFGGASQGAAAYLDTGIPESAAMTLLVASRATADVTVSANRAGLIGAYDFAKTPRGVSLYASNGTILSAGYMAGDNVTPTNDTTTLSGAFGINAWRFLAAAFGSGTPRRIYDKTAGTSISGANTLARLPSPGPLMVRIGANADGTYGPNDCAFAAIYDRALVPAEIDSVYAFVKAYLAKKEITV